MKTTKGRRKSAKTATRSPAKAKAKAKTAAKSKAKSKAVPAKAKPAARPAAKPKAKALPSGTAKPAPRRAAPKPASPLLAEGMMAPGFNLTGDRGETISLAGFRGRNLVVFFYPRAGTPGCTREAQGFTALAPAFETARTALLGVSADPVKAQAAFKTKHGLAMPLGSDETKEMLKAYGAWGKKSMYGKTFEGVRRMTFLIDGQGRIVRVWPRVEVEGHAQEVLEAARSLP